VGRHFLIVNRAASGLSPELEAAIAENDLELLAVLPDDPVVAEFDAAGKPLIGLPADSSLSVALEPVIAAALTKPEGKEAAGAHHR
jgi:CO dehydrogenase maturation factor